MKNKNLYEASAQHSFTQESSQVQKPLGLSVRPMEPRDWSELSSQARKRAKYDGEMESQVLFELIGSLSYIATSPIHSKEKREFAELILEDIKGKMQKFGLEQIEYKTHKLKEPLPKFDLTKDVRLTKSPFNMRYMVMPLDNRTTEWFNDYATAYTRGLELAKQTGGTLRM